MKKSRIHLVMLISLWFLWFLLLWVYLSDYAYKYPTIYNYSSLYFRTIPNLLLPVILLIISGVCFWKKAIISGAATGFICLVLLFISFFSGLAEMLGAPAICSHTTDPDNFAKYDRKVEELIELNASAHFPRQLPKTASNPQYYYWYMQEGEDVLYIAAEWDVTNEELRNLQSKYSEYSYDNLDDCKRIVCQDDEAITSAEMAPCLYTVVMINEKDDRIAYIVCNQDELIPDTWDEILADRVFFPKTGDGSVP